MYEAALTVGVFDMLHEGHINLFGEMRKRAQELHVIVHDDYSTFLNKGRFPVQNYVHRMRNVEHFADAVWLTTDADPSVRLGQAIDEIRKSGSVTYVRGNDWREFPGINLLLEEGVPIEFIPYTKGVSSTQRRDEL